MYFVVIFSCFPLISSVMNFAVEVPWNTLYFNAYDHSSTHAYPLSTVAIANVIVIIPCNYMTSVYSSVVILRGYLI